MKFPIFPSESREVTTTDGTFVVRRYGIVTTPTVVYETWERQAEGPVAGRHSFITRDEEFGWLGKVTSRELPESIAAIEPGSEQRIGACRDLANLLHAVSYAAIIEAFPDVESKPAARRTQGRIETRENVPAPDDESAAAVSAFDRDIEGRDAAAELA